MVLKLKSIKIIMTEELHTKLWNVKKQKKAASISDIVLDILKEWDAAGFTDFKLATKSDLVGMEKRIDAVELQVALMKHRMMEDMEEEHKQDEWQLSKLMGMSWPNLKVICAKYGISGVQTRTEAVTSLSKIVTIINDTAPLEPTEEEQERLYRCTNCGENGHGRNKCPHPIEEKSHFCEYCGRRDHKEEDCEKKGEDAETKNQEINSPCEKCGGWHRGDCKMV